MTLPRWSQALSVGDARLDEQHRAIFQEAAKLIASSQDGAAPHQIRQSLAFLGRYTLRHFVAEESLMEQVGYPDWEAHRALHARITTRVLELEAQNLVATSPTAGSDLRGVLLDLLTHIREVDAAYIPFVAGRKGSSPLHPQDPFHIGIPTLDEDHHEFFQAMENLHLALVAGRGELEVREVIPHLLRRFQEHTHREEMLMEVADYGGLAQHRQAHAELLGRLGAIRAGALEHSGDGVHALMDVLRYYLTDHITQEDMAFVPKVLKQAKDL